MSMTVDEINNVMEAINNLDVSKMEISDQLIFLNAINGFAETMRPLVVKYSNDLPESTSFLFKM